MEFVDKTIEEETSVEILSIDIINEMYELEQMKRRKQKYAEDFYLYNINNSRSKERIIYMYEKTGDEFFLPINNTDAEIYENISKLKSIDSYNFSFNNNKKSHNANEIQDGVFNFIDRHPYCLKVTKMIFNDKTICSIYNYFKISKRTDPDIQNLYEKIDRLNTFYENCIL